MLSQKLGKKVPPMYKIINHALLLWNGTEASAPEQNSWYMTRTFPRSGMEPWEDGFNNVFRGGSQVTT